MSYKYGVNLFINDVSVKELDIEGEFCLPEYKYIVDIILIESYKGNGIKEMKIYTEGELKIFEIGNWKVSPIIEMPFNWTGYSNVVEMCDLNSNVFKKKFQPDGSSYFKKMNYIKDIKWVFSYINGLQEVENVEHAEFLEYVNKTNKKIELFIGDRSVEIISELLERLKYQIENYDKILVSNNNKDILKDKINSSIDLFHQIKIRKLD